MQVEKPVGADLSQIEDDGYKANDPTLMGQLRISLRALRQDKRVVAFRRRLPGLVKKEPGVLILVRHGESQWNANKTFTGWCDPGLSKRGEREAEHAARLLLEGGFNIDVVYTSRLQRAIRSSWIILREMNTVYLPVYKSWRLNERMYGALQGLSKVDVAASIGVETVQQWRGGYHARPPPLDPSSEHWPGRDRKHFDLTPDQIPLTESLADCMERTSKIWEGRIRSDLAHGQNVLIVAHANALRGLVKYIDKIGDKEIEKVGIPTGIPLVYRFNRDLEPLTPRADDSFGGIDASLVASGLRPPGVTGTFLEERGLLRRALEKEADYAKIVPGYEETMASNRRDTTLTPYLRSLSKLEAQRQLNIFTQLTKEAVDDEASANLAEVRRSLEAKVEALPQPATKEQREQLAQVVAASDASGAATQAAIQKAEEAARKAEADLLLSQSDRRSPYTVTKTPPDEDGTPTSSSRPYRSFIVPPGEETAKEQQEQEDKAPPLPGSALPVAAAAVAAPPVAAAAPSSFSVGTASWDPSPPAPADSSRPPLLEDTILKVKSSPYKRDLKGVRGKGFRSAVTSRVGRLKRATGRVFERAGFVAPATSTAVGDGHDSSAPHRQAAATDPALSDSSSLTAHAPSVSSSSSSSLAEDSQLVIIRHGKTEFNKLGLFTGWDDQSLAKEGCDEAVEAGKLLQAHGFVFDVVYTSWLSRAIETAWLVLGELDSLWLPIIKSWRLNERMYGALTGLSKKMTKQRHGASKFKKWRRGFSTRPPPVSSFSPVYPGNDERYVRYLKDVRWSVTETIIRSLEARKFTPHRKLPKTESLKDCMQRTIPYFTDNIVPNSINQGKRVLIASSENAIRGLLMHLCNIPEERISEVEIPTGLPLVYDAKSSYIRLLDDGTGVDPLERFNFGTAADLLFGPGGPYGNAGESGVLLLDGEESSRKHQNSPTQQ